MRASSASARAGTFASRLPCSGVLERRLLDAQAGRNRSRPSAAPGPTADIRMPVSTGRVSSREAERATRETVCTNASAGSETRVSADGSGRRGEVFGAQRAQMKRRRSGDQLDVLLRRCAARASARAVRERTRDVQQQARRQDGCARAAAPRRRGPRARRSRCRSRAAPGRDRPRLRSSRRTAPALRCASRRRASPSGAVQAAHLSRRELHVLHL